MVDNPEEPQAQPRIYVYKHWVEVVAHIFTAIGVVAGLFFSGYAIIASESGEKKSITHKLCETFLSSPTLTEAHSAVARHGQYLLQINGKAPLDLQNLKYYNGKFADAWQETKISFAVAANYLDSAATMEENNLVHSDMFESCFGDFMLNYYIIMNKHGRNRGSAICSPAAVVCRPEAVPDLKKYAIKLMKKELYKVYRLKNFLINTHNSYKGARVKALVDRFDYLRDAYHHQKR